MFAMMRRLVQGNDAQLLFPIWTEKMGQEGNLATNTPMVSFWLDPLICHSLSPKRTYSSLYFQDSSLIMYIKMSLH